MKNIVFLPCELKPNTFYFNQISNYILSSQPAFIFGDLFEIKGSPYSDYIVSNVGYIDDKPILFGYACEITNDGLILVDKIKGFNGNLEANTNNRRLSHCYLNFDKAFSCWTYQYSKNIKLNTEKLNKINYGLWDMKDLNLITFAEQIVGKISE